MVPFLRSQYGSVVIETFRCLSDNYVSTIGQHDSRQRAVIDPGAADRVIEFINQENLELMAILNTHHHHDHIGGNSELQEKYKIPSYASATDHLRVPGLTHGLREGSRIEVAGVALLVLEIPGHTEGQLAYFNADAKFVFVGDTLFSMGCGRLFEGTPAQMLNSLEKLMSLPPDTKVFVGHEYTLRNGAFAKSVEPSNHTIDDRLFRTVSAFEGFESDAQLLQPLTIAEEMMSNPFLRAGEREIAESLKINGDLPARGRVLSVFTRLRELRNTF